MVSSLTFLSGSTVKWLGICSVKSEYLDFNLMPRGISSMTSGKLFNLPVPHFNHQQNVETNSTYLPRYGVKNND